MKCEKGVSFEDCELAILRSAIDKTEEMQGKKLMRDENMQKIIELVENFIRDKKLICYGGTAINNILPKDAQFYNLEVEIPDYDFFSSNALDDAKALADIYNKEGFEEVEAKSGVHKGTYKVFVNFIPVADITQLNKELFSSISKEAIKVNGIRYCPPNYLRMAMYLELSRPLGDVSRWEKVLKRLTLLNKYYPLKVNNCNVSEIQRIFVDDNKMTENTETVIFKTVLDSLTDQNVVFFGAFANKLYLRTLKEYKNNLKKVPDFDVLSDNPETTAKIVKERLEDVDIKHVKIIKRGGIGEIIAPHYEVVVSGDTICFIYEPLACHSYNLIHYKNRKVRIATIDTTLSFYLAFVYANRPYYDKNRLLCMSNYLFFVQQKNRLTQKGILKRFSISCYGKQDTIETMRAEKTEMFKKLKNKKSSKEYEEWFLRYIPSENKTKKVENKKDETKKDESKKDETKHNKTIKKHWKKKNEAKKNKKTKKGLLSRFFNL